MKKNVTKIALLLIAAVMLIGTAFAGAGAAHEGTPVHLTGDSLTNYNVLVVYVVAGTPQHANEYTTIEAAYSNVSKGGTIYLMKDVSLTKTFPIYDDVTIDGLGQYSIRADASAQLGDHNHLLKIDISQEKMNKGGVTLKNLTIDFNSVPGDVFIYDDTATEESHKSLMAFENVQIKGMNHASALTASSALHIDGANVTATNLTFTLPEPATLVDRWTATIDMQSEAGNYNSTLCIDSLPYGAYCKGEPQANIYQITKEGSAKIEPITIELLVDNLYVWPGFKQELTAATWEGLNQSASKADFGDIIKLTDDIISTSDPTEITIPKGVLINASRDGTMVNPFTINLTSSNDHIVVNDLLALASLLGYVNQVTYGKGYLIAGQDLTFGEAAKIPKGTKIWLERGHESVKNNVTVQLPSNAIIPVDEYGIISLRENKNLTIVGDGSITFTDDPLGNFTSLWVNGTLNFGVPVTKWPTWGINGTGTVNFFVEQDPMPNFADSITVNFAPFAVSGEGSILCDGTAIDVDTVVYKNGCAWSLSDDTITITTEDGTYSYTLSPASGYTGEWVVDGTSGTIDNARIFTAKFTKSSTPYTPTPSHKESGQTVIQQQAPVQDVSADPTPANQATADISVKYISQSVLGTSTADTAALKEQYPEAAAQVELSFALAMEAGIPLTNSKGAKAVVVTSENIPNVEKVTFSRVYEISPANAGEKLTKVTVKVPKSDVTSKGLTSDDVTVYHFLESYNIWVPLEIISMTQDANNYYYTAATDGTSPFGVLVKKIGSDTVAPTANPTTQPTQTQKSPAPFVGLIAGLGAALVLTRLRK